jgi:chromate transporter
VARMPPVPFGEALRFWLKLGFISFGGPAGQIAIMHDELVERRRWISERRFLHALNYCMLLPGPEATQLATYIGWLMHRTWGGIVAGGLFVLPSVFILIGLSYAYMAYGELPLVAGLLYGVKPAVVAIVLAAAWRIGSRALRHPALWGISLAAFAAIHLLRVPFPAIIAGAGLLGALGGRMLPQAFASGPAPHDDDLPVPAHARYSARRLAAQLAAGVGLWLIAVLALAAASGWDGALTRMALFFTKAALLTFGGAYAVLPYVYQAAVEQYHWLSAPQMIDGLALGETTPGPLIMVVAFVGFVGGWSKALFGPEHLFLAGAAAAGVVAFFTFLPSFVFILAGAPLVESTHGKLKFTAPLAGITAAVVGVVLSLALFFAQHVCWPRGIAAGIDWLALAGTLLALVALLGLRIGLIPLIGAAAALGALLRLWGMA